LFLVSSVLIPHAAVAADWPAGPLKIIVTFAPGGTTDTITRAMVPKLSEVLGQPVVIANVAGAGGAVGWSTGKDARPDGYTFISGNAYALTLTPLVTRTTFNLDDFDYLYSPGIQADGFFALPERGWKNLKEMFVWAKKENEKLNFGFQNPMDRVLAASLAKKEGVELNLVPLKGGADAITGVLGKHLDFSYGAGPQMPYIDADKLVGLSNFGGRQFSSKMPTLQELGYDADSVEQLAIFAAPKGVPAPILEKMTEALKIACNSKEFKDVAEKLSFVLLPSGAEDLTAALKAQQVTFRKLEESIK
jgi:tripartite-type tricarboxylate transporter receptor subunit TctC